MDRVAYACYRAAAALIRVLPIETGYRLGSVLGACAYWIAGPYRRLVLSNLRIAFRTEKSEAELRALAREHFAMLGANLFASVKLPTLDRAGLERVIQVEGLENMAAQHLVNGGFVFVISHIGNWEAFAQITPYAFRCKVGTIYQRLGNSHLDAEVRRDRARLGLQLFEKKEGFTAAMKFLREGGAVGVLMDQHAGDAGLWCPFFGRLASTTTLPAMLALRTGAVLQPAAIYNAGVARWRVVVLPRIEPRGESVEQITVRLNACLEAQIRVQPADWFWVHNRWKLPRPNFLISRYKRGFSLEREEPGALPPLGLPAEVHLPRPLQPFPIVIRGSNWLGDAVMSVPAVVAIKCGRPDATLAILTPAKLADFWRAVPEVDEVIEIAPADGVFAVARKLRGKFEAAIVFPNSLRTALEVWIAAIPRRVGYPGHRRAWLLNQVLRPKKKKPAPRPRHQVHHYLALADWLGAEPSRQEIRSAISGDRAKVVDPGDSTVRRPRLGLVPGAEYGPAKRWLPARFAEVMQTVHQRTGCDWRIFGVAKDREVSEAILKAAEVPATDLVGKTTLAELIAELRACDLILTNDTGTMHLAAHLGVAVVAIFGSTEPALTGPLGQGHTVLRRHVECSPCFLRECPRDFRCMTAIEPAQVVAAIESRLRSRGMSELWRETEDH